ncbi:MAG: hypothetical protein GY906_11740 [bacterium]|nr:hypothetical protein [bacterium]
MRRFAVLLIVIAAISQLGYAQETREEKLKAAQELAAQLKADFQAKQAEERSHIDFRKTRWGMSQEQVIGAEGRPPDDRDNDDSEGMLFKDVVLGIECTIFYQFTDGKLTRAAYMFAEEHVNPNLYIQDYDRVKEVLVRKYGEPINSGEHWNQTLYKDNPEDYGRAVEVGHLSYVSNWIVPRTTINLILRGDNFEVNHGAVYDSALHKTMAEERTEAEEEELF